MKTGIIAIKLKEGDELVDVAITKAGDEVILATAAGMAIRFSEADARPMGRNASGVKGIKLGKATRRWNPQKFPTQRIGRQGGGHG